MADRADGEILADILGFAADMCEEGRLSTAGNAAIEAMVRGRSGLLAPIYEYLGGYGAGSGDMVLDSDELEDLILTVAGDGDTGGEVWNCSVCTCANPAHRASCMSCAADRFDPPPLDHPNDDAFAPSSGPSGPSSDSRTLRAQTIRALRLLCDHGTVTERQRRALVSVASGAGPSSEVFCRCVAESLAEYDAGQCGVAGLQAGLREAVQIAEETADMNQVPQGGDGGVARPSSPTPYDDELSDDDASEGGGGGGGGGGSDAVALAILSSPHLGLPQESRERLWDLFCSGDVFTCAAMEVYEYDNDAADLRDTLIRILRKNNGQAAARQGGAYSAGVVEYDSEDDSDYDPAEDEDDVYYSEEDDEGGEGGDDGDDGAYAYAFEYDGEDDDDDDDAGEDGEGGDGDYPVELLTAFVESLGEHQVFTQSECVMIQQLVLAGNPLVSAAFEVYESDRDGAEFVDTIHRVLQHIQSEWRKAAAEVRGQANGGAGGNESEDSDDSVLDGSTTEDYGAGDGDSDDDGEGGWPEPPLSAALATVGLTIDEQHQGFPIMVNAMVQAGHITDDDGGMLLDCFERGDPKLMGALDVYASSAEDAQDLADTLVRICERFSPSGGDDAGAAGGAGGAGVAEGSTPEDSLRREVEAEAAGVAEAMFNLTEVVQIMEAEGRVSAEEAYVLETLVAARHPAALAAWDCFEDETEDLDGLFETLAILAQAHADGVDFGADGDDSEDADLSDARADAIAQNELLELVVALAEGGGLTGDVAEAMALMIARNDPRVMAAYDVYIQDQDVGDLIDTLYRCVVRPPFQPPFGDNATIEEASGGHLAAKLAEVWTKNEQTAPEEGDDDEEEDSEEYLHYDDDAQPQQEEGGNAAGAETTEDVTEEDVLELITALKTEGVLSDEEEEALYSLAVRRDSRFAAICAAVDQFEEEGELGELLDTLPRLADKARSPPAAPRTFARGVMKSFARGPMRSFAPAREDIGEQDLDDDIAFADYDAYDAYDSEDDSDYDPEEDEEDYGEEDSDDDFGAFATARPQEPLPPRPKTSRGGPRPSRQQAARTSAEPSNSFEMQDMGDPQEAAGMARDEGGRYGLLMLSQLNLTPSEKRSLKQAYDADDEMVAAALKLFALDDDAEDFFDTLERVARRVAGSDLDEEATGGAAAGEGGRVAAFEEATAMMVSSGYASVYEISEFNFAFEEGHMIARVRV